MGKLPGRRGPSRLGQRRERPDRDRQAGRCEPRRARPSRVLEGASARSSRSRSRRRRGRPESRSTPRTWPRASTRPAASPPQLDQILPADALAYVAFGNLEDSFDNALPRPMRATLGSRRRITELEQALGFSMKGDLFSLFSKEGAIAVYPAARLTPNVLFVLRVSDEGNARKVVDRFASFAGLSAEQLRPHRPRRDRERRRRASRSARGFLGHRRRHRRQDLRLERAGPRSSPGPR